MKLKELVEKVKDMEFGNLVLKDSFFQGTIWKFDEFDIEDEGNAYTRKGNIKRYEVKNFKEEYGVTLPIKKSEFPIIVKYVNRKREEPVKIKLIETIDDYDIYTKQGTKRGYVIINVGTEGWNFLVKRDKIKEVVNILDNDDDVLSDLLKYVGY